MRLSESYNAQVDINHNQDAWFGFRERDILPLEMFNSQDNNIFGANFFQAGITHEDTVNIVPIRNNNKGCMNSDITKKQLNHDKSSGGPRIKSNMVPHIVEAKNIWVKKPTA